MDTEETMAKVPVTVEFCGGLETIFNGEKEKKLQVEAVERKRGEGDGDDDDDDVVNEDANETSTSTTTTTTTTVARVAAAAAAAADPAQAHMLFVPGSEAAVRPGVLVLVNDADWELCGGARARVAAGDRVTFISTLHGG